MINNYKILAIIPARGGSKGLPRKNIRPLLGKPLIGWTIEQARNSRYLDHFIVNTDDSEIADIAQQFGAAVPFMRPPTLATDEAKMSDVILHTLDFFEKQNQLFDIVVILEPTSPLRKPNDIDQALNIFAANADKADSLVSVGLIGLEHPLITKTLDHQYVKPFFDVKSAAHQRQQLPPAYFPYGVIYLSKVSSYKTCQTFYQDKTIHYLIERWQNYEIDDLCDLITVEAILNKRLANNI